MFGLLRQCLMLFPPELSHRLALWLLKYATRLGFFKSRHSKGRPKVCQVAGLAFDHPVGLAAGFDKNGDYIDALFSLGFSFVEVGTVTPRPQAGNPGPRLFRLRQDQAVINRMGFNNKGIDHLVNNVKRLRARGPLKGLLGINIGKNATTPMHSAIDDYLICFKKAYPLADYITLNISSPNTKNLRELQNTRPLSALLGALEQARLQLTPKDTTPVPLFVKLSPDLDESAIKRIAKVLVESCVDGVIATNTTISRLGLNHPHQSQQGGLSGRPLHLRSVEMVSCLASALQGKLPIIGVGGILCAKDAKDFLNQGAALVQVYTGFIYHGPKLISQIVNKC